MAIGFESFRASVREALQPRNIRNLLVGALVRNPGFKLLSILFAVGLWGWVQGEQAAELKTRVDVEWVFPKNLALAEEVPDAIQITVSGSQMFVRDVKRASLLMKVDLSEAAPGRQTVEFQDRLVQGLPQNVRITSVTPTEVDFVLDKKISRKVKVTPITVGEPPPGYRIVGVSVEPKVVELEGPLNLLANISELPTGAVDVGGIKDDLEAEVTLNQLPDFVRPTSDKPIMMRVEVEAVTKERTLTGVPVVVRYKGWSASPDEVEVTLEGPFDELDSIDPDEVTVVVQMPDDTARIPHRVTNRGKISYRVLLPDNVHVTVMEVLPTQLSLTPVE